MVNQKLIEELREIIKKDYGKNLEIKEVTQIADNLVGYFNLLVDLLAKICQKSQLKDENHNKHARKK